MSVRPSRMQQLCSHWTYFHAILYLSIFRKSVENLQIWLKSDRNNGYVTSRPVHVYDNISLSSSRMINVSGKSCRENQDTNSPPPRKSFRLWDNMEKYSRPSQATYDNITQRMRFSCCITRATNTPTEYVIIFAFSLQQWLHERPSVLVYTCIACLVYLLNIHAYRTMIFPCCNASSEFCRGFCDKGYNNMLQNYELFHKERTLMLVWL